MKKLKMKDTILEHYQKVHELEMDGLTVRVWKPRTMQHLPSHDMLAWIKNRSDDAASYIAIEDKSTWFGGNPDYGLWDVQTVNHIDPRHKALDIYIAAILVRPYSREAYDFYCSRHEQIEDMNQRLMLMFDSREFDRIHGYDTSYGAYKNQEEVDAVMYRVVNEDRDILDTSPSTYIQIIDEEEYGPVRRCGMTLRQMPDGGTEFHAVKPGNTAFKDYCDTPLIQDFAKLYTDFRKQHPAVTEMRFYTDELVSVDDSEDTSGDVATIEE